MSRLLTPKWLLWHLTFVLCLAICVAAAWWQLSRAESATGDWQNWIYVVQWPLFALIGIWGYVRSIYYEFNPPDREETPLLHKEEVGRVIHRVAPRMITVGPHQPAALPEDPELAAYNRHLAQLADKPTERNTLS